ncbi:MAG: hypothetical protein JHC84_17925 [Solirubrobacteraceae bacterium]|nr:hypothetical protein [Solirubrobacteraceae bacterium]
MSPMLAAPSAGGAETTQVLLVTAAASLVVGALVLVGLRQRTKPLAVIAMWERWSRSLGGLPGWAAIPASIAAIALIPCLLGLIWDESLHIDNGRDAGPLANPSHYLLLLGLLGGLAAGWLAVVLPKPGERPGPAAVRITSQWYAPVGGLLITAASSFSLLGFPLDDLSHRLFGQDVTLWGTTHLWMMVGPVVSVLGLMILLREGRLAMRAERSSRDGVEASPRPAAPALLAPLRVLARPEVQAGLAGGGFLLGLTIFQGEFDYGVPQFRLLYHPVIIAGAAALALVVTRIVGGRVALVWALGFYLATRSAYTVIVGPVFGQSVAHFPLYLVEAGLVELAAVTVGARRRPVAFGLVAGALVGSVGVLAEFAWSQVWMPIAWPAHILPAAIAVSLPVAAASGLLGVFIAAGLRQETSLIGSRGFQLSAVAAVAVIGVVLAGLRPTDAPPAQVSVTLEDVRPAPNREVVATVRFDPPEAARDADWLRSISYQGGEPLRTDELREIAADVWQTAAMPVHGTWKSSIRLHRGTTMAGMPVFLPRDEAIPADEVPAPAAFTRPLVVEKQLLQREAKEDVPAGATLAAQLIVLGAVLSLLGLAGWSLVRLGCAPTPPRAAPSPSTAPSTPTPRSPVPV